MTSQTHLHYGLKINKVIAELTYAKDLADIHRTFSPTVAEYTFFSSVLWTYWRADRTLRHKGSLIKCENFPPLIFHEIDMPAPALGDSSQ